MFQLNARTKVRQESYLENEYGKARQDVGPFLLYLKYQELSGLTAIHKSFKLIIAIFITLG